MKKSKLQVLTALLAIMLVFSSIMVMAQTSRGTVTGVVTDPTGAVVTNATVTLTAKQTNQVRTTTTTDSGVYRFDAVNLGEYDLAVEASGFSKGTTSNLSVSANRSLNFDFQLKPGAATTEVSVEASSVEALQTTEQLRGKNIDARNIADLPIGGQNSLNLILTVPGIIRSDSGGSLNSGIGSVNGSRPRSNNFMIDGVENNDISVSGPSATLTNNDAIQEVSIQTSNFSAEFGRAGGAVVNQITKSGTNAVHGTAAFVYLSENFNAANRDERNGFDPTSGKPVKSAFHEIIPAFTLGGPVYVPHLYDGKNGTFFFAAGQWDRLPSAGTVNTFQVPTAAGVATLQALAGKCPAAAQYLAALDGIVAPTKVGTLDLSIPAAVFATTGSCTGNNRAGVGLDFGNAGRAVGSLAVSYNNQIRVDHKISDKQQISFRWLMDNLFQNNATVAISKFFDADQTSRNLGMAINHTYVLSSTMTNEFRFNYGRLNPNFPLSNVASAGGPQISFGSAGTLSAFGASATFPQGRTANTFQYQDTIALVKGKHSMRFGADFLRQLAKQFAPFNSRGTITYQPTTATGIEPFSNFLDDFSGDTGTTARLFGSNLYRPNLFRQSYFFQDSWRATSDLTLNLGLRYENFGTPMNIFTLPVATLDPTAFATPSKVKGDNNNFGPSLGFAWNPHNLGSLMSKLTGDGKMVIRGGFQTTYDTVFNNLLSNLAGANPNNPANIPVNASVTAANPRGLKGLQSTFFPNLAPAPLNPATDAGSQFQGNLVNPYTDRWSLGFQRELPSKMVVDVSYVGSISRKQFINQELNPRQPNAAFTAATLNRLVPGVGSRTPRLSEGNSNYNGLQVEARRSYSDTVIGGLQFGASYTWSKSLDTVSEAFVTNSATTSLTSAQNVRLSNRNLDYGVSDFNHAHRFVTTIVWDVRGPKGNGILGQTLGGWSLSYVIPLQTGEPFTIQNGRDRDFDGASAGDRPDLSNPNAPENSRGKIVTVGPSPAVRTGLTNACPGGFVNPDIGGPFGTCVTANDVRFIQVAATLPGANTVRRNNLVTPGSWLVDMNVLKKFSITERFKFEYRAEIFNLANHENFDYTPFNNVNVNSALPFLDYTAGRPLGSRLSNSRTMRMGLKLSF